MRPTGASALIIVVVLAGCTGGLDPGSLLSGERTISAPCDQDVRSAVAGQRADPERDLLGWENGVWHNESIGITQSDGMSCGELELVLARAMARVETIRELEFEQTPTVTIASREAFRRQLTDDDESVSDARRGFTNVKYEALLMVNESADAISVRQRNRGASVAGFYAPSEDSIMMFTETIAEARVHEGVLAHELVHALQDQHFEAVDFPAIEDVVAAHRGITEGDANYVEYRYERRCQGPWLGTCMLSDQRDEKAESGTGSELANKGMYTISYQPYSDGPPFVDQIRERGGWEAVNDLYRNPPASTEQTIHPALYPDEEPVQVELRDRSSDRWSRITVDGRPDYETWGERGLYAMFLYPAFQRERGDVIVPPESFLTPNASTLDPYNYSYVASAGWAGDTLHAYRNESGELAYTWRIAFDSQKDAREFVDTYERLLELHDARASDERESVWIIPEGEPFADAFSVTRTDETVLIVNAPTTDELHEVHREVDEVAG